MRPGSARQLVIGRITQRKRRCLSFALMSLLLAAWSLDAFASDYYVSIGSSCYSSFKEDGVTIPGSAGLTVDLRPDALFNASLRLASVLSGTKTLGVGQTGSVTIPIGLAGLEVFYAAVSIDLAQGQFTGASPTHSFQVQ